MKHENQEIARSFYETLDEREEKLVADRMDALRKAALPLLTPLLRGRALCLGRHQALRLSPPAADLFVIADFSATSLSRAPRRPNLLRVCARAAALPFDIGSFDTVVMPGILHHLAEDTVAETNAMLQAALNESARVLKREGRLVVFEPSVSPFMESVIRSLFLPARLAINRYGLPMMCPVSVQSIAQMCSEAGIVVKNTRRVEVESPVSVSWFLPDWRLPYPLMPWKFHLIEGVKRAARPGG